jgi:hypothetical protein
MTRAWRLDLILSGEQGLRLSRGTAGLGPLVNAGRDRHAFLSGAFQGNAVEAI